MTRTHLLLAHASHPGSRHAPHRHAPRYSGRASATCGVSRAAYFLAALRGEVTLLGGKATLFGGKKGQRCPWPPSSELELR